MEIPDTRGGRTAAHIPQVAQAAVKWHKTDWGRDKAGQWQIGQEAKMREAGWVVSTEQETE